MGWACVTYEKRNACRILMDILERIRSLERSKRRRKDNIKIGIKELG
jgi:acyl-ACP thioesterase